MKWYHKLKNLPPFPQKKNKLQLILILFILGALLLLLPNSEKKESSPVSDMNIINQTDHTKKELEKLLSELTGVKTKILYTYKDNGTLDVVTEENLTVETNPSEGVSSFQRDKKPMTDSSKNVIIKNRQLPTVKGVCIFHFGPYKKETEELLYRAVKSALGAEIHTVEVIFKPL